MSNVDMTLLDRLERKIDRSGEPPDDGGMEARIAKLEEFATDARDRMVRIEVKLDTFADTFANKADLHKEISAQTWRLVTFVCGFATALVAAVYFIAKNTA